MITGLILTWLFWPPLAAYFFTKGSKTYAWVAVAAPFAISGLMYGMSLADEDTPLFLSLFIHGIVVSRLVAEAFSTDKESKRR